MSITMETGGKELLNPKEFMIRIYGIRHGESSEDKTDPLRGLTEQGIGQVVEAVEKVCREVPDKSTMMRLYSSGSERTRQQCIVATRVLKRNGYAKITIDENSLPEKKVYFTRTGVGFGARLDKEAAQGQQELLIESLGITVEGPGVAKRIKELKASPEYMKGLRDKEKETGIGAAVHWLVDENIPEGTETPAQKVQVIDGAVETSRKYAELMREKSMEPVVALVFSHASGLSAMIENKKLRKGKDPQEVENAEGVRIDLSGVEGERPVVQRFERK